MNQAVYDIQIRSLRAAVEHMGLTDLRELHVCALLYGTPEDRALIRAMQALLNSLPPRTSHLGAKEDLAP